MQGSLLEPGAGSGYRGLGTRGWEASLLGHLFFDASASFPPLQSSPLCCHGHPHMGPSPPPSPSPDALPFSQCPPHMTRVPKTQFQMSGRADQFGHRRGSASVWPPAEPNQLWLLAGGPHWADSELCENRTELPPLQDTQQQGQGWPTAGPPERAFSGRASPAS